MSTTTCEKLLREARDSIAMELDAWADEKHPIYKEKSRLVDKIDRFLARQRKKTSA